MANISLPERVRVHKDGFVNTFVSRTQRQRWRALLALDEKRWGDIDVHGFEGQNSKGLFYETKHRANVGGLTLQPFLDADVIVLRLGHSKVTGAVLAPLRQALDEYDIIFEGVISVVAGKLAIVINHDDEAILCESS